MISSKYFNIIVSVFVAIALIFTSILVVFSNSTVYKENVNLKSNSNFEYVEELFGDGKIMTVDISVDETTWNNMLENATDKEYISCDVTVNGKKFSSVGVRAKGNSTLTQVANSDSDRYSLKLKFDKYIDGQTCFGLDKFVLNNVSSDSTYMKEYLSYKMLDYIGVNTPLCTFSDISVNGEKWGFYVAVEAIEESFAERIYGLDNWKMYKPESDKQAGGNIGDKNQGDMMQPPQNQNTENNLGESPDHANTDNNNLKQEMAKGGMGKNSTAHGEDFVYIDDNVESYSTLFENPVFELEEGDEERVIEAIKNLNSGTELEKYIDVDQVLRYFAANTVMVNLDSYVSSMKHNYYLYEKDGQISILPWDYNMSFAGFQSNSASNAVNFPIDTPVSGVELSQRPLIGKLLEVDEYKELYHNYIRQIVEGFFNEDTFSSIIDETDLLINNYVKNDPTAFTTYEQYKTGLQALKSFAKLRSESLLGQLDGTIPSTSESQAANPDSLVDASSLNLSDMGSHMGGEKHGNNTENIQDGEIKKPTENNKLNNKVLPPQNSEGFTAPNGQNPPQGENMKPPENSGIINDQGDVNNQLMLPPETEGNEQAGELNLQNSTDLKSENNEENKQNKKGMIPPSEENSSTEIFNFSYFHLILAGIGIIIILILVIMRYYRGNFIKGNTKRK